MDTANVTKLGVFVVGLALVGLAAAGVGGAISPAGQHGHQPASAEAADSSSDDATASEIPGGLMVSQDGFTLELDEPSLPAAPGVPLRFRILGPDREEVTDYERTHGKDLHLIVVRRDMVAFQHVHPTPVEHGTWSAPLDLSRPGEYRVFADFTPGGRADSLTLGADLSVAGDYDPQPLPEPSRTAYVDGYAVTLDGVLRPGRESRLVLSVSRDGEPVTDLQPYLGAYGHLVVLRDGDLSYLHVHPAGHERPAGHPADHGTESGPDITFMATTPSAGRYRLFLDFRHQNTVHTAEFTAVAGGQEG